MENPVTDTVAESPWFNDRNDGEALTAKSGLGSDIRAILLDPASLIHTIPAESITKSCGWLPGANAYSENGPFQDSGSGLMRGWVTLVIEGTE